MKTAVIGIDASGKSVTALRDLRFDVILLPRFKRLPSPIASHPDSLLFLAPGALITHEEYYNDAKEQIDKIAKISSSQIILSDEPVGQKYPNDVLFNAVLLDGKIICNKNTVSRCILECAESNQCKIIHVKQGYAKCSTLVLDGNSIITADTGIHSAATLNGVNSLLISSGNIEIDEYGYGFIGGAAGVENGTVYFNGNIALHPDYPRIIEYCESIVTLNNDNLYDIGTIFFI